MEVTKSRTVGTWVLRLLLAGLFLMAGTGKLLGDPMMVDMFGKIRWGQGFRFLTGTIEVTIALLILWPRTSFLAAVLMLGVLAGAFVVQLFVLHGDVIHVIVIAIFVGILMWLARNTGAGPAAS